MDCQKLGGWERIFLKKWFLRKTSNTRKCDSWWSWSRANLDLNMKMPNFSKKWNKTVHETESNMVSLLGINWRTWKGGLSLQHIALYQPIYLRCESAPSHGIETSKICIHVQRIVNKKKGIDKNIRLTTLLPAFWLREKKFLALLFLFKVTAILWCNS